MEPLDIGSRKDLVIYRLQSAKEDLNAAKVMCDISSYKAANNRAYYSILHAINAIHALDGKSYKRHKDVIGNFNKDYIKTEIFPREMGRKIAGSEEIRHASDYDDFYIATEKEARQQVAIAEEFLKMAEVYCMERLK